MSDFAPWDDFVTAVTKAAKLSVSSTGWIKMTEITAVSYTSISVVFRFHYKPTTNFTANSIRLYYTTTPGQGNADYVDITPENADSWRLSNETKNNYIVRYTLKNLPGGAGTTYYVRVWLRLFNKNLTKVKYSFKSPAEAPIACSTKEYDRTQPLFAVGNPEHITDILDPSSQTYAYMPKDFTKLIRMGTYDVLMTDVTEEWTDANYEKHLIVPRTKVTGKFDMLFSNKEEFNEFLYEIDKGKSICGESGKIYLGVHLNNQLYYPEDWEEVGVNNLKNIFYWGYFYISITSIPWVEPYYGHYDKYNAISVSIEEV